MSSIINADTSNGLKLTSDTTGQLDFQSAGSTKATIDTAGNFKFDSGYGSVATAYGCRAWVNFNGTGTVAIRGSANVSSITDNGTGSYTVNLTTAMPDANYSVVGACSYTANGVRAAVWPEAHVVSSSAAQVITNTAGALYDCVSVTAGIFR